STWVEALAGTGLLGTGLLLLCLALVWWRGVARASEHPPDLLPVVLIGVLTVRSLTGFSIESFGYPLMLFLALALLSGRGPQADRPRRGPDQQGAGGRPFPRSGAAAHFVAGRV